MFDANFNASINLLDLKETFLAEFQDSICIVNLYRVKSLIGFEFDFFRLNPFSFVQVRF